MKQISIPGFTADLTPDDKPAISVFGPEGTGKSRFACTAPDPIGYLALDKKAKRTAEMVAKEFGKQIIINQDPFMTDKETRDLAMLTDSDEDLQKTKAQYTRGYQRVLTAGEKLAAHKDIETIVLDTASQFFDWILFSHFGRRTQIPPTARNSAYQDMIDFINMMRSKNLIVIHRSKEIWKDTGQTDNKGKKIQEPSGKFEADGFKNMGAFVTATIELTNKKLTPIDRQKLDESEQLAKKFRLNVVTCQTNSMLEGLDLGADYGLAGETINWDLLMSVIGAS